jgi:hypothetical protein
MDGNLIEQFIDKKSLQAMTAFLTSNDENMYTPAAEKIADAFGANGFFNTIANPAADAEKKLISSFHNNLVLLVQKTWVDQSDQELKEQVLYHLEQFCQEIDKKKYTTTYVPFLGILNDIVYLMFGAQAKSSDFDEYTLRIDPEFGIFWWYVKSLPRAADWPDAKSRIAILLGMYFLANY